MRILKLNLLVFSSFFFAQIASAHPGHIHDASASMAHHFLHWGWYFGGIALATFALFTFLKSRKKISTQKNQASEELA